MRAPGATHLFQRVGANGETFRGFGVLIENQLKDGLVLDGWIEPDDDGGFVYAGRYSGLLASYSLTGEQRYVVKMIDPPDLPKVIQNSEGVRWVDREALDSAVSVSVSGQEIHLLSPFMDGFKRTGAIDTYSLVDGSYLYSNKIPAPCYQVVVTEHALYTVDETTVSKWRRSS